MLFYIQMRWNIQGRLSQDELWDLESIEAEYAKVAIGMGKVIGLYKVAAERCVIGIVDLESIEELDRIAMGGLPMAHYLEFEKVWALREYEGFAEDVKQHYKQDGQNGGAKSKVAQK